jgi:hypothetical protein
MKLQICKSRSLNTMFQKGWIKYIYTPIVFEVPHLDYVTYKNHQYLVWGRP